MTPQSLAIARIMISTAAASFAAVLSVAVAAPGDLAAQTGGQVYERRDECVAGGRLTAEQCDFAYRNARAEYEQKAPRYGSRGQCERAHKRCAAQVVSSGGWESFGRGGASYVPRFVGVRVTGEGEARRALPVVEGGGRIAFAGRPIAMLSDRVAGRPGVIGVAQRGGRGVPPQASGPYVRRGDRDDTVPVPMEQRRIGSDVAPGLYVDPDGTEWYKPARRR